MARNLLLGTALQTCLTFIVAQVAQPANAQPLPNARPTGGTVVAGSAAISRTSSHTRIDQSTQRTAIDWKSFDVGSQQSVTFSQPSASSVALNRVTGPDPSQIAGRIDANGQFILVNQSGVNFYKGAQVNAAGVMVSAANISNQNFMAGVMKFDQPGKPNARIDNQGSITVRQAGLAALVAPQVANSGVITAQLGHVVLAGAKTATLDLFGDGLLSLDVSNQVTQAPIGKDGKAVTTLVTNTGTIIADGGTVQLTARAADGIVQNLVQASGTVRAATMGDQTGVVALNGVGGSIVVEGQLSASGSAPGGRGGAIEVVSNGNVSVAATARIDASGKTGGGTVAVGTALQRARDQKAVPTEVAANTVIQKGATISADATANGNGGRIAVLSSKVTNMAGTITSKGGPQGGNGGFVEVSGGALSLTGFVDASAPLGTVGQLLLDPSDLWISDKQPSVATFAITPSNSSLPTIAADQAPNATTVSWVSPAQLEAENANISLAATNNLFVATSNATDNTLDLGAHALTLMAGANLTIDRGFSVVAGGISLTAAAGNVALSGSAGVAAKLISSEQIGKLPATNLQASGFTNFTFSAGGAINLADAKVTGGHGVDLSAGNGVTQTAAGSISSYYMYSTKGVRGDTSLLGIGNSIQTLGSFVVTNGNLNLVNGNDLVLGGDIKANNLFFEVAKAGGTLTLGFEDDAPAPLAAKLSTTGTGGRISLIADNYTVLATSPDANSIVTTGGAVELAPFSPIKTSLLEAGGLVVGDPLLSIIRTNGGTLDVGGFTNVPAGATTPSASASSVIVGPANLTGIASTLRLDSTGPIMQTTGPLVVGNLSGGAGTSASLTDPTNLVGSLGAFTTTTGFALVDNQALLVAGPVKDTGTASTLSLTTRTGDITLGGAVSAANLVNLVSAGAISETGTLTAGTLSGLAATSANLNGANRIATLGDFTTGSFKLNNSADLLIAGTLDAAHVEIRAPSSQISLGDGATIITGGTARPPGPFNPALAPSNDGTPGALLQAANFTQIGSSTVLGQGSNPATLQIATTGHAQFDPPLGLQASNSWLILDLANGTTAGNVFVNALDVSYTTPGSANLSGSIAGITGGAAAAMGFIQPAINMNYLFNGCVIAATVCQPLPTPTPIPTQAQLNVALTATLGAIEPLVAVAPPSLTSPPRLSMIALPLLSVPPPQLTDPDVVPPNITYLDY
jgi:filamentous hemagglutinin family protein